MNDETPNNLVPLPLVAVEGVTPEPPLCVPDPETQAALVALGQSQSAASLPPCEILETIDLGVLPWSKRPIREISPLIWFKYEREDVSYNGKDAMIIYNIIDGNGRNLFCVNEEGMANFFVNAANIYVHASLQNQL